MNVFLQRLSYMARQPMAWFFSMTWALFLVSTFLGLIGMGWLTAMLNVLVLAGLIGLYLGRHDLHASWETSRIIAEAHGPEPRPA